MADDLLTVVVASGDVIPLRSSDLGGTRQGQHVLAGEKQRIYLVPQSLVLTGAAQGLTVPSGATHALVYAEGGATTDYARYWHGADPTSAIGKKLKDDYEVASAAPSQFKAINGVGTVTLRIEYYYYGA